MTLDRELIIIKLINLFRAIQIGFSLANWLQESKLLVAKTPLICISQWALTFEANINKVDL